MSERFQAPDLEKLPGFNFVKEGPTSKKTRLIALRGSDLIESVSKIEIRKFGFEDEAFGEAQSLVSDNLRQGFKPTNYPPLQPAENPRVVSAMAVNFHVINPGDLCRWLTMYRFSGSHPWNLKKIWNDFTDNDPTISGGALGGFLESAIEDKATDRFCWRGILQSDGQIVCSLLALAGDPGAEAILSFAPPPQFEKPENYSVPLLPGTPIEGLSIRRPFGGFNKAFFRDGSDIDF